MKVGLARFLLLAVFLAAFVSAGYAQKIVTIPQLQQVSRDSLLKLDTLQDGAGGKSLQQSSYWHGSDITGADTVTVTGVVIVKPGILTYTLARYNIYIQDTTTGQFWGGLNVLTNDTSTQAQSTGITALDTGMVVTMTGRVTEFGPQNNSLTEIFHYSLVDPVYTSPPTISIGTIIARPAAREITLDSLAVGNFPKPSRAEKYESMYVIVRNVTVNTVDYNTGRFSFQDGAGNVGYTFDGSGWYTLRGHKFSSSSYAPPPAGTKLSYIRGVIVPRARTGTCGDYAIMPMYPGDIGIESIPAPFSPTITSFTPQAGPIGTSVTISGSNFDPIAANNTVYFGGLKGTVTSATSTSLTVTVPAGASYARIGVTVNGLTAISQKFYTVTFTSSRIIDGSTFSSRIDLPASSVTYNVVMADLDGDGKLDLVAASYGSDRVFVFRNISTSGSLSSASFAQEADFSTGDLSTGLILVDLDGDGKLDIVASHHNIGGPDDHHIAVLRNTSTPGAISFEPAKLFEAGTGPFSVAADDFDHDGRPDLVVANFRSNNVSFLRNTSTSGTVSFDVKQDFPVANYPRELAAADIDGDGKPDIAVACGGEIDVLRNITGTSVTFAPPFRLTGTGSLVPMAVSDFDGDGKLDLATANNANEVLVFPNTSSSGSLSFGPVMIFPSGENPWDIAIGDFDGDGRPDLAVANRSNFSGPGSVSVLRNTSLTGTISFAPKVDFGVRIGPGGLAVGDLDGDGRPDIAVSHEGDSYLSVLRNNISGEPVIQLPPTVTSFTPQSGPVGTSVTITGSHFDPTAANNIVYFGAVKGLVTGATSTSLTVTVPAGASYAPITVTANGLTGYSNAGFVVTFRSGHYVDASSFAPSVQFTTGVHPFKVLAGDLNGDGKPDLVVSSQTDNIVSIFQNISSVGSLTSSSFANRVDLPTGNSPSGLAIADIDGDGKLDILVPNQNSSTVSIYRNISVGGTITPGSFAPRIDIPIPMGTQDIAVGDLDGDGRPDLVVANGNQVSIFQNTSGVGTISFGSRVDYVTGGNPIGVGIGDLDGDGKPEIIAANYGLGLISVFRNISTPGTLSGSSFAARVDVNVGLHPWYFVIGDLDGDGKPDIAVGFQGDFSVTFNQGGFSVLRNTSTSGSISFAPNVDFKKGSDELSIAAADIDGDGKVDLIVRGGIGVTPYLNKSTPGNITSTSFVASAGFPTGGWPQSFFAGDLDGDGKPDIVASNYYYWPAAGQSAAVLRNTMNPPPNNSVLFDGQLNGSRIRVADGGSINPAANQNAYKITGTSISVEAWVYPLGFPDPQWGNPIVSRPLSNPSVDPWHSYSLWVYHGNGFAQPAFSISAGTPGSQAVVLSSDTLPTFQWTHLAGTYDGATLKIYVNGILKGQYGANVNIHSTTGIGFYVGRYLSDRFQGAIDDVRLWNITRSTSDIQSNLNTELTGGEAGLAGYWNMNGTATVSGSTVVVDQTVNHNDLQVQGQTPIIAFNPLATYGMPTFSCAPAALDFGTVEQGSTSTQTIGVTNTGDSPLLGTFEIVSTTTQLAAGGVFFVPAGQTANKSVGARSLVPGPQSGALTVRTNANAPIQIPFKLVAIALRQFDANSISMWTLRDGRFATDPITAPPGGLNPGLEWPKGSGKHAVFASGIWVGAQVNGIVKTAAASYSSEFQPGPISGVGGMAVNPNDTSYRVYKIAIGDNASTNADYAQWPATLGAPVNPDGTPRIIGDQTLFAVYNDLNAAKHSFGTQPLGAEVQQTTFGFNQSGARGNTVFVRFKIINKSTQTWQNTYVSLWSDPDLGNAGDDLIGIDVPRNLGYVYNGSNTDAVYGTPPPAAGYNVLEGAFFTKPIQGFSYYINGVSFPYTDPTNGAQAYNFMQGLWANATPYIDPTTSAPTTFVFPGDPVTGTGWNDHNPGDRRFLFSTGPFNLEPGQSKELIAAITVGQGSTNLNSITALRSASDEIRSLYTNGQIFGGALADVAAASASSGSSNVLNDITQSGAQLTITGGAGGATVEVGSYVDAPSDAQSITTPSIAGVGKYLDVQVQGTVQWPVDVRMYYTRNDLLQAGIVESDLQGMYYWSGLTNSWKLYSNSGSDDQGRGPSTTGVDTTNVTINGVDYDGYVAAAAYHLMPMTVGARIKSVTQRYDEAIQYVQSLSDAAFKKPAAQRRSDLVDKLGTSKSMFLSGNIKAAVQKLQQDILNHLTSHGNSSQDLWVVDDASRAALLRMVNDLIDVLQRPQSTANMAAAGASKAAMAEELPTEYGLSQNYPNPFNPSTAIQYQIPQAGQVSLKVYNTLGVEVATLLSGYQNPGVYRVQWSPQLPSGVYVYRLQVGTFVQSRKLILLK